MGLAPLIGLVAAGATIYAVREQKKAQEEAMRRALEAERRAKKEAEAARKRSTLNPSISPSEAALDAAEIERELQKKRKRAGYMSTILTGSQGQSLGSVSGTKVSKKTLLGV